MEFWNYSNIIIKNSNFSNNSSIEDSGGCFYIWVSKLVVIIELDVNLI